MAAIAQYGCRCPALHAPLHARARKSLVNLCCRSSAYSQGIACRPGRPALPRITAHKHSAMNTVGFDHGARGICISIHLGSSILARLSGVCRDRSSLTPILSACICWAMLVSYPARISVTAHISGVAATAGRDFRSMRSAACAASSSKDWTTTCARACWSPSDSLLSVASVSALLALHVS